MSRKNKSSDQRIALVIWRNVIAAVIILMLIVTRQWIIQTNIQKGENLTSITSASLRQLIVSQRVESDVLSLGEAKDSAERDAMTQSIQSDLLQWEEYQGETDTLFLSYQRNMDASAAELKASSDALYSKLSTSVNDLILSVNASSDPSAASSAADALRADFQAYQDAVDSLSKLFENVITAGNMQTQSLETILFYVLILAVLLQMLLVFLPGQRKLYASFEQMRFLGEHDRLTELYHPYTFQNKIEQDAAIKNTKDTHLYLILLDINELPSILQKSGRSVADEVLRRSAKIVKSYLGAHDYAARLQNDTFVMLVRGRGDQEMQSLAERLVASMKEAEFPVAGRVSSSTGIAVYHEEEPVVAWMSRTETALIQARGEGRNRIVHESMIRTHEMPGAVHWQEEWASGHNELDSQHRLLIDLGNQLLSMHVSGSENSGESLLLQKFRREIISHFIFEEKLMRDIGYPDTMNHSMIHERLTNKAQHMIEEFQAHNLTAGFIYSFLVEDIIIGHIEAEDTKFFPMLPKTNG